MKLSYVIGPLGLVEKREVKGTQNMTRHAKSKRGYKGTIRL